MTTQTTKTLRQRFQSSGKTKCRARRARFATIVASSGMAVLTLLGIQAFQTTHARPPGNDRSQDTEASLQKDASRRPATAASSESAHGDLSWLTDPEKAFEKARSSSRPVLVDVHADWCVPCQIMDRKTWADPDVQQWMDEKAIPLRIDMDSKSAASFVQRYEIEFVPAVLLIAPDGKVSRRTGFVSAKQLLELLK